MGLDRETIAQVLVSITAVGIFIAGLVVLSITYGTEVTDGVIDISPSGGLMLVGFIAFFIVIMPVFGYLIERKDFEEK